MAAQEEAPTGGGGGDGRMWESSSAPAWWGKLKSGMEKGAATVVNGSREAAQKAMERTDDLIEDGRKSETWQNIAKAATEAKGNIATHSKMIGDRTVEELTKLQGAVNRALPDTVPCPKREVVFHSTPLGMTLSREEPSGRPVVTRVDVHGNADTLGVRPGDIISEIRSDDQATGFKRNPITTYDELMGIFPAYFATGAPVTITFDRKHADEAGGPGDRTGGVMTSTMEEEIAKSARMVRDMTEERTLNPDAAVPQVILKNCMGLAFLRVAKVGFGLSAKIGTGIVVAKTGPSNDSWSAPFAVGTGGLGWGLQLGAELTDYMIVLNTPQAVKAFASGRQVTLGGNVSIAVGPVGRNMGGGGNMALDAPMSEVVDGKRKQAFVVPCYSYAHSKGLFMGISMEGGVIEPRKDINSTFYGTTKVDGAQVLGGGVPPPKQAQELYYALAAGLSDDHDPPRYQPSAAAAVGEPTSVQPGTVGQEVPTATPVANPFVEYAETDDSIDAGDAGGFVGGMGGGGGGGGGVSLGDIDVDVDVDVDASATEGEYPPVPPAVPAATATSFAEAREGDGKGSVAF